MEDPSQESSEEDELNMGTVCLCPPPHWQILRQASYMTRDIPPMIAAPTRTNTFPSSATLAAPPVLVSLAAEPVLLTLSFVVELLVDDAPESAVVAAPVVMVAALPTLASEVCFELVAVPVGVLKPSATADAGRVSVCDNVAT
jgi:hypothetical protein